MGRIRAHIFVSGDVQGVGFRYFIRRRADALGLNGWVKNLEDGRVEIVAEGEEALIDRLIDLCWRGPPLSNVSDVSVVKEKATRTYNSFDIAY